MIITCSIPSNKIHENFPLKPPFLASVHIIDCILATCLTRLVFLGDFILSLAFLSFRAIENSLSSLQSYSSDRIEGRGTAVQGRRDK